jgi:hypothetical protein
MSLTAAHPEALVYCGNTAGQSRHHHDHLHKMRDIVAGTGPGALPSMSRDLQ